MKPGSISFFLALFSLLVLGQEITGQRMYSIPVYQSQLAATNIETQPLDLRSASRNNRWIGVEPSNISWSPDSKSIYFQWAREIDVSASPILDPWFRHDVKNRKVVQLTNGEASKIPISPIVWDSKNQYAAWSNGGNLFLYESATGRTRKVYVSSGQLSNIALAAGRLLFVKNEQLWQIDLDNNSAIQLTEVYRKTGKKEGSDEAFLRRENIALFEHIRSDNELKGSEQKASDEVAPIQVIPIGAKQFLDQISLSPDGRNIIFRVRTQSTAKATEYLDYNDKSGYSKAKKARPKVGQPMASFKMGLISLNPSINRDSIEVKWLDYSSITENSVRPHGPFWNLEGNRAVVQLVSEAYKDIWLTELDVETGKLSLITKDHDDAWIGGPPIQSNYLGPAFFRWLPGDQFVFASERSGWSHLYLANANGEIVELTKGQWEVREAQLSNDKKSLIFSSSENDPTIDQLFRMKATGGDRELLTKEEGRSNGWLSPDGKTLAYKYSDAENLPDLFVKELGKKGVAQRVTASGSDNYYKHPLRIPEVVSFAHEDGGKVWAGLYKPDKQGTEKPAIIHLHGGGYRQFSHKGYSVYGFDNHLGFINYMVQEGYTVLDLDYRGSAGFGRDYRTDIYRSMGVKDVESVLAGVTFLKEEQGIDPGRIGIYGISYGGFLTLATLFRHQGIIKAGIANAAVTDWAHYNQVWTGRILNQPVDDPEAYEVSSPINHAVGLQDKLLITHGLNDYNVHFQDAARLVQKLMELEKDFEWMVYPIEPHTIETEANRYDYVKRAKRFFDEHLLHR